MVTQHERITITDVAHAAGVSNSAVSYALNGRAGVSPSTRDHILEVARQLGWQPNHAAQSLSASHSRNIGLILDGDPSLIGVEPYFMKLIGGITQECEKADYSLILRHAPSAADEPPIIREWIASNAIDGLILTNIEVNDSRLSLLTEYPEFPVVAVAEKDMASRLPVVWSEGATISDDIVDLLAALGHRVIARVSGPAHLSHTQQRDEAFSRACAHHSLTYFSVPSDYTPEGGRAATEELLAHNPRPTAIIYDNDVMAVAGMSVVTRHHLTVPNDLSLMCWDDSILCTAVTPSLTAVHHDTVGAGREVARMLFDSIRNGHVHSHKEPDYTITIRKSTSRAPQAQ